MNIYDVVIVGAGPVGLATALGLQKHGIKNILVIDQTRAFRRVALPSGDLTWSAGRTVLVGDAAHGMPPFMAQGANQGFEDALAITTQIANIAQNNNWDNMQAITQSFEIYEKYRRPFMEYIQHATLTRFPQSSEKLSEEYSQKVYSRNLNVATGVMLCKII